MYLLHVTERTLLVSKMFVPLLVAVKKGLACRRHQSTGIKKEVIQSGGGGTSVFFVRSQPHFQS